jgi:hypothetical protein
VVPETYESEDCKVKSRKLRSPLEKEVLVGAYESGLMTSTEHGSLRFHCIDPEHIEVAKVYQMRSAVPLDKLLKEEVIVE